MFRLLLSTLVLYAVYSLNTYSHTTLVPATDSYSTYSLGSLSNGDVITFLVEFPNAATTTTTVVMTLLDNSYNNVIPQPTNFGSAVSINFQGSHTTTWTCTNAGTYYIRIAPNGIASAFVPYYLTVTHSNGNTLVKVSDILRFNLLRKIYLSSAQSSYVITRTSNSILIFLFQLNGPDYIEFGGSITSTSTSNTQVTFNLAAGYYVVRMLLLSANLAISYSSDPYVCPFNSAFPDAKNSFAPCADYTAPTTSSSSSSSSS